MLLQIGVLFYRKNSAIVLSIGVAVFIVLQLLILEPVNYALNVTRDFVHSFEKTRHQADAEIGFYDFGRDALAIKFMANLPHTEIAAGIDPLFIDDTTALFALQKKVFFITKPKTYDEFPPSIQSQLTLLSRDKIGHAPIVVFAVTKYLGADDVNSFR